MSHAFCKYISRTQQFSIYAKKLGHSRTLWILPTLKKCFLIPVWGSVGKKIKLGYSTILTLLKVLRYLTTELQVFQIIFVCPFQLKSVLFLLVEVSIGLIWDALRRWRGWWQCEMPRHQFSRTDLRDSGRKDFPFPISATSLMPAALTLSWIKGHHGEWCESSKQDFQSCRRTLAVGAVWQDSMLKFSDDIIIFNEQIAQQL